MTSNSAKEIAPSLASDTVLTMCYTVLLWSRGALDTSVAEKQPRIVLRKVPFGHQVLIRRERNVLYAAKSNGGHYYTVEVDDFYTPSTERSIEKLQRAVQAVLHITWKPYVLADSQKMTPGQLHVEKILLRHTELG